MLCASDRFCGPQPRRHVSRQAERRPWIVALVALSSNLSVLLSGVSLILPALLGAVPTGAGGATVAEGALRVTRWDALTVAVTAGGGALCGTKFGLKKQQPA